MYIHKFGMLLLYFFLSFYYVYFGLFGLLLYLFIYCYFLSLSFISLIANTHSQHPNFYMYMFLLDFGFLFFIGSFLFLHLSWFVFLGGAFGMCGAWTLAIFLLRMQYLLYAYCSVRLP